MDENKTIFVEAVRSHPGIPDLVKSSAESVVDLVRTTLNKTYFEFLDKQIELCQRGPEWNKILQSRRNALFPFCGKDLLRGLIKYEGNDFIIRVELKTKSVVHWEEIEKKQPPKRSI
jgi:hypothetical protein